MWVVVIFVWTLCNIWVVFIGILLDINNDGEIEYVTVDVAFTNPNVYGYHPASGVVLKTIIRKFSLEKLWKLNLLTQVNSDAQLWVGNYCAVAQYLEHWPSKRYVISSNPIRALGDVRKSSDHSYSCAVACCQHSESHETLTQLFS